MATIATKEKRSRSPGRVQDAAAVRLTRVEVVPELQQPVGEAPVVVCVGAFRVEVSGNFSTETLAAVLDVVEGLQR